MYLLSVEAINKRIKFTYIVLVILYVIQKPMRLENSDSCKETRNP